MNGPWSDAVRAWTGLPAAWGQRGDVAAAVGTVGIGLAAPAARAAPLAWPVCDPAAAGLVPGGARTTPVAVADCRTATLAAVVRPGPALPWTPGPAGRVGRVGLTVAPLPGLAATDAAALARTARLAVAARACLAGTGTREAARLVSRLTTAVRRSSAICRALCLRSAIDIEQR